MTGAPGARRLILPAAAVAAILLGTGLAFALTGRPPASRNPAATARHRPVPQALPVRAARASPRYPG